LKNAPPRIAPSFRAWWSLSSTAEAWSAPGVEAVDNPAPAVMDDDGDAAAVGSRHLVAATDSWQIIDDEVETAIGLHALGLLNNRTDEA
jgi:hypothetical protein